MGGWWLIRRLALMLPTFLGITLVTFLIVNLAAATLDPGQEVADLGRRAPLTREERVELRQELALDLPLIWNPAAGVRGALLETRYARWLGRILHFDFGESLAYRRPVSAMILARLPVTLAMQLLAVSLMFLVAVPLGVWSATTRRRRLDKGLTGFLFLLFAAPNFWVATLMVLFLGRLFPVQGLLDTSLEQHLQAGELDAFSLPVLWNAFSHLILPVVALSYAGLAVLSRYARSGLLEVLGKDYVRTARARGLSERRVIWRHAAPNGLLPLVTLMGGLLPTLVGGSIIVEKVFNIPGMGLLTWDAAQQGDVPLAMGIITLVALLTMLGYLASDLVSGLLDPRIKYRR